MAGLPSFSSASSFLVASKGVEERTLPQSIPAAGSGASWRGRPYCCMAELGRRKQPKQQRSATACPPRKLQASPQRTPAITVRRLTGLAPPSSWEEGTSYVDYPPFYKDRLQVADDALHLGAGEMESGSDIDGTSTPPSGRKVLAAVDLGTNSFHMVVVKADSKGSFQIDDVEKEDVRLGSGSACCNVIGPEAEERAVAAMRRLKKIAETRGAEIRAVGTSAVRDARNQRAFVKRLQEETGVEVEVLSGREEACLIYLGILQAMPVYHRTVLTVDIGGGSTEFVIGRKGKPLLATSLKLGHIRLMERFSAGSALSKADVEEMRRHVRVILADSGVIEAVRSMQGDIEVAIGSSGTIETIEQMIAASQAARPCNGPGSGRGPGSSAGAWTSVSGSPISGGINGNYRSEGVAQDVSAFIQGKGTQLNTLQLRQEQNSSSARGFKEREFTREQLSAIVKKLCKAKTAEQRAKIPGLPEKRVDVIVGGAVLLEEIFLALGIQNMKVSPYALREGVIVDTISRSCREFSISTDLRRTSVMNLAHKFNTDRRLDSALHSAALAKQILSGLLTCRLGGKDCLSTALLDLHLEMDCEILEAATILHYVGMFISHRGYHKHSHYLIKHSEQLLGYSPIEIEMIALLVRYHRKKVPSNKDEELAALPEGIRQRIRVLTCIMRVAVALDRCDTGAVERVLVLQDMESCVLAVTPSNDPETGCSKDISLEVWAARAELDYFQKVLKKATSLVLVDDLDAKMLHSDTSDSLSS